MHLHLDHWRMPLWREFWFLWLGRRYCHKRLYARDTTQHPKSSKFPLPQRIVWPQVSILPRFRKGKGTRNQIASIHWIIEKAGEFQKNIYLCFIDYAKAFDCVDHNKLWKIFQEMRIADHFPCLLRNLYAGQEATVRTGYGTTNWFQLGKDMSRLCKITLLI